MFGLLGWLWERALLIYEWFGPKFHSYLDTIRNIWQDAYDFANEAYNQAVDWIARQVTWLRSLLTTLQQSLVALLKSVSAAIYKWAESRFVAFQSWVTAIKREILTWALSAITEARIDAHRWVETAKEALWNIARGWVDEVLAWANPTIRLHHALVDLLTVFTPVNKARVVDFLERGYRELVEFFQDPRGFIYGKLETTFVSFLCYVLAQAIGTEGLDVPKTFSHKEN